MNTFASTDTGLFVVHNSTEAALQSGGRLHAVKSESNSPSPGLPSSPFSFTFRTPIHPRSRSNPEVPTSRLQQFYTFRPAEPFDMSWVTTQNPGENISSAEGLQESGTFDVASLHQNIPFTEEYDDFSELAERPGPLSPFHDSPISIEKAVRRRSSKACDQCRKSKCKCELLASGEPCKSCTMLGTQCTFLGPSRKRGPPKGYIDAIEARLHQTEALLGIMLCSKDERAQSLFRDIAEDPLACAIINRVDQSSYGSQGHKRAETFKTRTGHSASDVRPKIEADQLDLHSTHPSCEWQAQVIAMLDAVASHQAGEAEPNNFSHDRRNSQCVVQELPGFTRNPPRLQVVTPDLTASGGDLTSPTRRQRRRIEGDHLTFFPNSNVYASQSPPPARLGRALSMKMPLDNSMRSLSPLSEHHRIGAIGQMDAECGQRRDSSPFDSFTTDSEEDLVGAAGQLSLNEDEQVRYHGKASGLHLLGDKDRIDRRNEGGIWRFPTAGVWPPLPNDNNRGAFTATADDEFLSQLPDPAVQVHLVDLYFTHVHPSFPIVHKRAFFDVFRTNYKGGDSPRSTPADPPKSSVSPFNRPRGRISTLLLLAMFAIAARYSTEHGVPPPPPDGTILWAAGDEYLDKARVILNGSYASSRSSTCQALLLMGYREIGIGAMAQAWIYIGMAIRMAQDLGLHRSADGWARAGLGGRLFSEWELHERKRIWYGCVIMDKYVSTYIGRPLSTFEWDFDTPLPSEDEPEEFEEWKFLPSKSEGIGWKSETHKPVPGRIISCFNASATLSGILSMVVQAIYAVRPTTSLHSEALKLESLLDKWYIKLPEHLRHELGPSKLPVPPPHILTLHMQYWCTVLLLHRPFIRHPGNTKSKGSEHSDDGNVRSLSGKGYEMCTGAANHITSIVSVYIENYSLDYCSVFLCYYIFTASIMHITTLATYPADPQAHLGLSKCMDALRKMRMVWPSAGRALDLLTGSKVSAAGPDLDKLSNHPDRHKRSAEQHLDVEASLHKGHYTPDLSGNFVSRSEHYNPAQYSGAQGVYMSGGDNIQPGLAPVQDVSFPSYERWPSESIAHHPYPGTISTSVLPQLYSTGLVDEHNSSGLGVAPHDRDHGGNGRYPQYWNDYSTFPQLGTAYGDMPALLDQTQGLPHPTQPPVHFHPMYAPQGPTYLQ